MRSIPHSCNRLSMNWATSGIFFPLIFLAVSNESFDSRVPAPPVAVTGLIDRGRLRESRNSDNTCTSQSFVSAGEDGRPDSGRYPLEPLDRCRRAPARPQEEGHR